MFNLKGRDAVCRLCELLKIRFHSDVLKVGPKKTAGLSEDRGQPFSTRSFLCPAPSIPASGGMKSCLRRAPRATPVLRDQPLQAAWQESSCRKDPWVLPLLCDKRVLTPEPKALSPKH